MSELPHIPIMVQTILDSLQVAKRPDATYIDGTLGAGGHSHVILNTRADNRLLGLDRDPRALELAHARLMKFGERATLRHTSYLGMVEAAQDWLDTPTPQVDGILLDLGLSSMQLDQGERGFSFRQEAPLDMRFDPTSDDPTAADLVNHLPADELANILYQYGEERNSRKIARVIVENRPIETTVQLAELIAGINKSREKIHPATRSFQALRIAVNRELEAVEKVLPIAVSLLKDSGRLAIISFHSLEDRIVKQYFKQESTDCLCPPKQPICTCGHTAQLKLVGRKPYMANDDEIAQNPRARSAKLRVVEKK